KLGKKLVERLLLLVLSAKAAHGRARATERIEFVDEDDAGCGLLRLLEKIAHTRRADTDKEFDEFGARYGKERHARFAGDRAGKQRLARARRPDEKYALRHMGAEAAIFLLVLEKGDDFLKL